MNGLSLIREIGFAGLLDILFMWLVVYAVLVWSKRTRVAFVLTGILIVSGIYLLTRQFNMVLAAGLLEKFFAIILIALVIIFQEELRHLFEQIAVWSLHRRIGRRKVHALSRDEVDVLVRTLADLAKDRIGALIVIRGKDLILRHLDGGIDLGGRISEELLKSLFDPNSMGHDGAVYLEGNRVIQFSCHLPLSKDFKKIGKGGTRHAAALGLSEFCDALCAVVSEERGTISVARHGELKIVSDAEQLRLSLERFYEEMVPLHRVRPWEGLIKKNSREKVVGFILACAIWLVLVYGSKHTYKTFAVPVTYHSLALPLAVREFTPDKVYVTLGGPRNAFVFLASKEIKLSVRPKSKKGIQKIRLYPTDIQFPKDLTLAVLAPQEIEVHVEEVSESAQLEDQTVPAGILDRVKKIIPFLGPNRESETMENELSVENLKVEETGERELPKAERIPSLEDAKPEEVARYLEKKLETQVAVEPAPPQAENQ